MKIVKKVASFVGLVVSVLFLLVFLACTVGVWFLRGQVMQVGGQVATVANQALERGQSVTTRLSTRLDVTQARISTGVTLIQAAGAKVEQTPVVLTMVEELLDKDLSPAIDNLKEQAGTARDALAVADQVITMLQRLPGTRAEDSRLITAADSAVARMQAAGQRAQEANQALVDAKSTTVANVVDRLTTPLENIGAELAGAQDSVQGLNDRLGQAQTRVQDALNTFNLVVSGAVIGLTLVFLWLALSQVALFIWAYRGFTGRDLLKRKPAEEPSLAVT